MENDASNFPCACNLPGRVMRVPYVIVANDAFPFNTHIMKPYSGQHTKGSTKRIFNDRLSRVRRIVDNEFEIVSSVFRGLRKPILLEPSKAQIIVMACATKKLYFQTNLTLLKEYLAMKRSWGAEDRTSTSFLLSTNIPQLSAQTAHDIRDELAAYLMTEEGKLSWQDKTSTSNKSDVD
ncbi:hypothetical protein JTB14_025277 [Gonioctena quinquepunctata]|nr:hypothetical protein JTB14_025277 [Gonioctena quinquepunctata]